MATAGAAKPRAKKPTLPKRPGHLPQGRWLADLGELSAAEKWLVECCARGEPWAPEGWDGKRPKAGTDANKIKADLIRFLVLGGDAGHPVHEAGVMIFGAWIEDKLNLHQCIASFRLDLKKSHLIQEPNLLAAQIPELSFGGSHLPGLRADRLKLTSGLFLNDGFNAKGTVRLLGATIGGNLDCSGGSFSNAKGFALSADRIDVAGNIFLKDGFKASGTARFLGATIGGDLDCSGGSFSNAEGYALIAERIDITGALFLRDASIKGAIVLTAAKIGTLADDVACWEAKGHGLDGLHYDRIIGPTDASSRIKWLKSQREDHLNKKGWKPQPWEQLIKILREMGHPAEANEVAIEKQRMMRQAGQIGTRQIRAQQMKRWPWLEIAWIWLVNTMVLAWHYVYGALAGFGYRPGRILLWMAGLWLVSGFWFSHAAQTGLMAPSSAEIVMHRQLHADIGKAGDHAGGCGVRHEVGEAQYWPVCTALPSEYTTFNPWLYSADLILPLVDLQQDGAWSPAASFTDKLGTMHDIPAGMFSRSLMWLEILFGWFASLMFVAIVSRLVEKD
jgi:hypothetical protein